MYVCIPVNIILDIYSIRFGLGFKLKFIISIIYQLLIYKIII